MKKSHVATATLTKTVGLVALASALAFPAAAFANTSPKGGGLPDKNSLEQRVEQAVLQAQQQERKIDKAAIERLAFKVWKEQRAYLHSISRLYFVYAREAENPRLQRGRIYFTERKKLLSTPITVDEQGNFSVRITGEDANGREHYEGDLSGKYVRGTRRADGYYVVSTIQDDGRIRVRCQLQGGPKHRKARPCRCSAGSSCWLRSGPSACGRGLQPLPGHPFPKRAL